MSLAGKSLHDLRIMAQGLGVSDIFSKSAEHLAQEITIKQMAAVPPVELPPNPVIPVILADAPVNATQHNDVLNVLAPHIARGLHVSFDDTAWHMRYRDRSDSGTLTMPLHIMTGCAIKMMRDGK